MARSQPDQAPEIHLDGEAKFAAGLDRPDNMDGRALLNASSENTPHDSPSNLHVESMATSAQSGENRELQVPDENKSTDGPGQSQITRRQSISDWFDNLIQSANDELPFLPHHDTTPTQPNKAPKPAVPSLKIRLFHPSMTSSDTGTLDVIVVYMFGNDADDSDTSVFVRDEQAGSSLVATKQEKESAKKKSPELQSGTAQAGGGAARPTKSPTIANEKDSAHAAKDLGAAEEGRATTNYQNSHGISTPSSKPTEQSEKHQISNSESKPAASNPLQQSASPATKTSTPLATQSSSQPLSQSKQSPPHKGTNWLSDSDMLPAAFPESRILGFGFNLGEKDAPIDFEGAATKLTKILSDYRGLKCSTPLVFIGHGYGSVVIEILLSRDFGQYPSGRNLVSSTAAVHLFAPPIDGSTSLIEWTEKTLEPPNELRFMGLKDTSKLSDIWSGFKESFTNLDRMANIFVFVYGDETTSALSAPPQVDTITSANHPADNAAVQTPSNSLDEGFRDPTPGFEVFRPTAVGFSQIATFAGPKDKEFRLLIDRIKKAVQTRQLLGATERGETTVVQALVNRSFNVNLSNRKNQTALLIAAINGKVGCTKILLESGQVDIDHQDNDGNTALHLAVMRKDTNSEEVCEELLKANAGMFILNNKPEEKSAYRLSRSHNIQKNVRILFRHPPLVEGPTSRIQQLLEKTEPPKPYGERACKRSWVAATEAWFIPSKDNPDEKLELHMTTYKTVQRFIYSDTPIDEICIKARPRDVDSSPHCRWFHIPANNMAWVNDLFVKLGFHTVPWPRHYRDGGFPHSKWMSPESSVLRNLDDSKETCKRQVLAILMPYISYEESDGQRKMSKLITQTWQRRQGWDTQDIYSDDIEYDRMMSVDLGQSDGDDVILGIREKENDKTPGVSEEIGKHTTRPEIIVETAENTGKLGLRNVQSYDFAPNVKSSSSKPTLGEQDSDSDDDDELDDDDDDDWRAQIKAYLAHDPPLHPRRTLDQSYYHMLPSTSARDSDQVVARRAKKDRRKSLRKEGQSFEGHNILMVDQLWLWFVQPTDGSLPTIITSFPDREGVEVDNSRIIDDLQENVFKTLPRQTRDPIRRPEDIVSRLLTLCCKTLDRHQHIQSMQFLQLFKSTIGDAEAKETKFFEDFRIITEELYSLHDQHPEYQRLRSELLKKLLNIRRESRLLKNIRDVLDEIKMIKAVLDDQLETLKSISMLKFFWKQLDHISPGLDLKAISEFQLVELVAGGLCAFPDARKLLDEMKADFDVMETHAKDVEEGLDHLMELKQMQANLWEAHSSREGADENSRQGNTLLVFTVVTIIFLPLSFMASFFALGVQQFPRDNSGNTNWPLGRLCGLLFGISFAVSLVFLFVAFKIRLFTKPWKVFRKILLRKFGLWLLQPLRLVRVVKVREQGYSWYKRLTVELYEYQTKERDNVVYHAKERKIWLEGLQWELDGSVPSEPVKAQKAADTETQGLLKAPKKAWHFDKVNIYILRGSETDDKVPRKSKFYDDLAAYGEILWQKWPAAGFHNEHQRYKTLLRHVSRDDPDFKKRTRRYRFFIRRRMYVWLDED